MRASRSAARRLDEDREILQDALLANELARVLRPQRHLFAFLAVMAFGGDNRIHVIQ